MTKEQEEKIVKKFEQTHRIAKINGEYYPQRLSKTWVPFSKKTVWKFYYVALPNRNPERAYFFSEKEAKQMLDAELKKALNEDKIIPYRRTI